MGDGSRAQKNCPGPWVGFGPVVCHSYVPLTPEAAWLNNCVGHYNHRYFFSFCLFMTMGCIYCSISGWEMFQDAYAAIEVSSQAPALSCHAPRLPGPSSDFASPLPPPVRPPAALVLWGCEGKGPCPAPLRHVTGALFSIPLENETA